jgi:GNAT superfamily N-acetyltransferase
VTYREATSIDVPAMEACRRGDPEAGRADPRMEAYLDGLHHPGQALAPRVAFVAESDGQVAGYIAGHLTRRFKCRGELQYLYVAPVHRRTGVASSLVRLLAQWFLARRAHRVCVNAANDRAEAFYHSVGAEDLKPHWLVWDDIESTHRTV